MFSIPNAFVVEMIAKLMVAVFGGWTVEVHWEGLKVVHKATSWEDALEWAAQYPSGLAIIRKGDKIVACKRLWA